MGWGRPAPGGGQQTRWGGSHLSSPVPRLGRPSSSGESLLHWGRLHRSEKARQGSGAGRGGPGEQARRPRPRAPLCSLQDLRTVLSLPRHPGEFLHPVVYACTAVMLLCLLTAVVTYLVHQR